MTADLSELCGAIADALNLPYAAIGPGHDAERARLLESRAFAVGTLVRCVRGSSGDPEAIREELDRFQNRIAQLPVTYPVFIGRAADLPEDVSICGPGCHADVLGVHVDCPGPRAGAEVVRVK